MWTLLCISPKLSYVSDFDNQISVLLVKSWPWYEGEVPRLNALRVDYADPTVLLKAVFKNQLRLGLPNTADSERIGVFVGIVTEQRNLAGDGPNT